MWTYMSTMSESELASRIREARTQAGLSQEQLGVKIGATGRSVARWESGASPKVDTCEKIAEVCGVTLAWLIGGAEHAEAAS